MPDDTSPTPSPTTPPINPVADQWTAIEGDFKKGLEAAIAESTRGVPAEPAPSPTSAPEPTPTPPTPSKPAKYRLGEEPPPPAPSTPPPAEVDDPSAPIPEFKSAKAEQWRQVHERSRGYLKRAVEAEEKLKEAQAQAIPKDRLTALEKERDTLENELQRIAIERSPRFNQEYQGKFSALLQGVRALVPIDQRERVASLIQSPDSPQRTAALEEVLGSLSPLAQRDFADRVISWSRLTEEKSDRIRQASDNWRADQEKALRDREERAAQIHQTFAARQDDYRRRFTSTDDTAFNQEIDAALKEAQKDADSDLPAERISDTYIEAKLLRPISRLAIRLSDELDAARAEIASLKGAGPDLGAPGSTESETGATPPSNVREDLKKYGSVGGAIAADMARMGLRIG